MNEATSDTLAALMRKHIEDAARAEHLAARLKTELTAERARRIKAEEVVEAAEKMIPQTRSAYLNACLKKYHAQYPRVE